MRLWSLHPCQLDTAGLVALWREGLLARAVLRGQTRGYTRHPQLLRFRAHPQPRRAIDAYLHAVCDEADARGYRFDRGKLGARHRTAPIPVADGQRDFEWGHLLHKLQARSPQLHARLLDASPRLHPSCVAEAGPVADWERP